MADEELRNTTEDENKEQAEDVTVSVEGEDEASDGAEKAAETDGNEVTPSSDGTMPAHAKKKESALNKVSGAAWLGICIVALVIGILLGMFVLSGTVNGSGQLAGKNSVPESALDTPMATYTSAAGTGTVTIRDAIMQESTLEAAKESDGTYSIPSADMALSVARNNIILDDASKRGITISDDEVKEYAEKTLGSSDYAAIASSYGMDEATVKKLLSNSLTMSKLQEEIVPKTSDIAVPEAPAEPTAAEGEETDTTARTKEYAEYIIKLAGDEWDASKDTWTSSDGPFATALAGYDISAKDGASYEAAAAAYYVAYQEYALQASSTSNAWTEYVNGLLNTSTITVNTLLA